MAKRDHYHDPDAPPANDLTPVLNIAVFNDAGELLLLERPDNGFWSMPGGFMEVGESFADAALRELAEETSVRAEITGIVGIYSDPGHITDFGDGTVHQQCTICLAARATGGSPTRSPEAASIRYFSHRSTSALYVHPTMRMRIDHSFNRTTTPHIG